MKIAHHKQGFTLVELSIVLVIIGLLIGGILVGQSLIESAKITKTIKEFQSYNIAAMQFREKFKCLPGDCVRNMGFISKYGHNGGGAFTGDGNGYIGNFVSPATYFYSSYGIFGPESFNFWAWLEQSGYIPAIKTRVTTTTNSQLYYITAGVSSPTPPIFIKRDSTNVTLGNTMGGWWILPIDGAANVNITANFTCRNAFWLSSGGLAGTTGGITTSQALSIDYKIDDGLPQSGNIAASGNSVAHNGTLYAPISPTSAANCLDSNTPKNYNASYTGYTNVCGVLICADF